MSYTIKDLEKYGYETFNTTISQRHPEWTITSTTDFDSEEPTFTHYDVDVTTDDNQHYEVEIKTRMNYTLDSFDDLQIDETKVKWLQDDIVHGKCDRAFLCGIYPIDGEMVMWEIHSKLHYQGQKSYRPKQSVEQETIEYVLKSVVSFPINGGKRIKIHKQDEQ